MKISVVMSAYNAEKSIRKAVKSVMDSETAHELELIVVEDCSTDGTKDALGGLLADYGFTVIEHGQNMGSGQSRRDGIEAATGDYVITIDSDDWIAPDFLDKLAGKALETEADIVSGGVTIVYEDGYKEVKCFPEMVSEVMKKFGDYNKGKIIFLNNKLVRRSMYGRVPYCTRRYCEDTPVILPLLYHANKVAYADTQGYFYRQHAGSLCHRVTPFEDNLYKALFAKECIEFFADKEPEYRNLVGFGQFAAYMRGIKAALPEAGCPESLVKEFAEVMCYFLKNIKL